MGQLGFFLQLTTTAFLQWGKIHLTEFSLAYNGSRWAVLGLHYNNSHSISYAWTRTCDCLKYLKGLCNSELKCWLIQIKVFEKNSFLIRIDNWLDISLFPFAHLFPAWCNGCNAYLCTFKVAVLVWGVEKCVPWIV